MKSIAVTGTIGSGKSACSQILREMGFPVFDCDEICHGYLEKDGLLYERVIDLLSDQIVDENREIDRKKVAELIFDNAPLKKQYEQMFHECLKVQLQEEMLQHELFFAEVPLLYETGFDTLFDESWVVVCDEKTAVERCVLHRGMKEEDVKRRILHQMSKEEKMKRADVVLDNSTTVAHLRYQIEQVLKGMNKDVTACENSISG